ncbi:MAG: ABC transporter ATP-binding protein [Thermotogae bacterium]|jgi:oligopeptide/dipeptide ABC transporter ATP-binding protein|nr:ABC transporter ATP-binding protein [Thermotogota bacterium]
MNHKLLEVKDLHTVFHTEDGTVEAVSGVNFEVYDGETLGIVGESGCGKSVTSLSIMRLLPKQTGEITKGEIIFKGKNILKLSDQEMRHVRGKEIAMIFQEPMTALNPVYTAGEQVAEMVELHLGMNKKDAYNYAVEMFKKVGIPMPEKRVYNYPHELSGGLRQRVMIAMALSCNPSLLIADEPTTALDVTIQAQVLDLMRNLLKEYNSSLIMITHDLGVVAEIAQRVAVMYAGQVVEYGNVITVFKNPSHPYTIGLMRAIPRPDVEVERLVSIEGNVPDLFHMPKGCRFNNRCPYAIDKCMEMPPLFEVEPGHFSRCWRYKEIKDLLKKEDGVGVGRS